MWAAVFPQQPSAPTPHPNSAGSSLLDKHTSPLLTECAAWQPHLSGWLEVIHPFHTGSQMSRSSPLQAAVRGNSDVPAGSAAHWFPPLAVTYSLRGKIAFQIMKMTSFQETCLGMYDLTDTATVSTDSTHCQILDWLTEWLKLLLWWFSSWRLFVIFWTFWNVFRVVFSLRYTTAADLTVDTH